MGIIGFKPGEIPEHDPAECRDFECGLHGDDMFCEACERWVEDEGAPCDGQ